MTRVQILDPSFLDKTLFFLCILPLLSLTSLPHPLDASTPCPISTTAPSLSPGSLSRRVLPLSSHLRLSELHRATITTARCRDLLARDLSLSASSSLTALSRCLSLRSSRRLGGSPDSRKHQRSSLRVALPLHAAALLFLFHPLLFQRLGEQVWVGVLARCDGVAVVSGSGGWHVQRDCVPSGFGS